MLAGTGAALHPRLSGASPATRDQVAVAVVADFGPRAAITPRVVVKCLTVPRGTNGSAVLAHFVAEVHLAAATYAPSGLLCSIGGEPATGCGTPVGGGYAYWSYWHGGSHWTYANVGPAEWTVATGDVEGWRFESTGHANGTDPPPSGPSEYAAACANATTGSVHGPSAPSGPTTSEVLLLTAVGGLVLALMATGAVRWRRHAS